MEQFARYFRQNGCQFGKVLGNRVNIYSQIRIAVKNSKKTEIHSCWSTRLCRDSLLHHQTSDCSLKWKTLKCQQFLTEVEVDVLN